MKKTLLMMTSLVYGLVISACSGEETRTVEWYEKNKEALAKKITECENNPGEKANTPNCINAKTADSQLPKPKKLVIHGLNLADYSAKVAIMEYYANYNKWPENNKEAGLPEPEKNKGLGIGSITVNKNTIRIVYTDRVTSDTQNNDIILTVEPPQGNDSFTWSCNGGRLPNELRPDECKIP